MVKEDGSHFSDQQVFAVTIATSLVIVVSVQVRWKAEIEIVLLNKRRG